MRRETCGERRERNEAPGRRCYLRSVYRLPSTVYRLPSTDQESPIRQSTRVSLVIIGALTFGVIAWAAATGHSAYFDDSARAALMALSSPGLTVFMRVLSNGAEPVLLAALGAAIVTVLYFQHRRRDAARIAVLLAGTLVLETGLKLLFGRARPDALYDFPLPSTYSFPSSHACFAIVFGTVMAWLASRSHSRAVRVGTLAIAAILVALVGASRVYLGVHYPTDVVAGYVLGATWVGVVGTVNSEK